MATRKLAHFHLIDGFGNKSTLICTLSDGSIGYTFYSGINTSGTPYSLSNLQCDLPLQIDGGTKEDFVSRLKYTINVKSVYKIINEIKPVVFDDEEDGREFVIIVEKNDCSRKLFRVEKTTMAINEILDSFVNSNLALEFDFDEGDSLYIEKLPKSKIVL